MIKCRSETRDVQVKESVTCNKCGKSCRLGGEDDVFGFITLKEMWGYESDKDGEAHQSHMCEQCYDALIATFVIPPEIRRFHPVDQFDPFDPEVEQLVTKQQQ